MANRTKKYNPSFLTSAQLVKSFVVRQAELERISGIVRENTGDTNQHVLVIGPRGAGKTMLALRVVEQIRKEKDLCERWYPIVFGEESYQVCSAGEFWLEALFHLGHKIKGGKWMQTYEELREEVNEDRLRERALAQLMDFADEQGKRLVLVVENLNMLLGGQGGQISEDDAWKLRKTLLHERRIMILATATSHFEQIKDSDKAMFELFKIYKLEPLEEDECRILWSAVSGNDPGDECVRPLQILTGGNPRLLTIISGFAAKMSLKKLMQDLMQLVDEHTEYFKSHLDSLAPTMRKAYLSLAELWIPSTARDVASAARLGVNKVSAMMGRLMEKGMVVEADGKGRTKYYQVAERMYNIYYLMRRRGTPSGRVRALVRFMVSFYSSEELASVAGRIAEEACQLKPELRRDHLCAIEGILENARADCKMLLKAMPEEFLKIPDVPALVRDMAESADVESEAARLVQEGKDLEDAEKFEEAEAVYRKSIGLAPTEVRPLLALGNLLLIHFERPEEAENVFGKVLELQPKNTLGLVGLGFALWMQPGHDDEMEQLSRKLIEFEPENNLGWVLLGFIRERLGRYEEAEEALRKAIDLNPDNAFTWSRLGWILGRHLKRYEEAEEALQKAIELEPESVEARWKLALLLARELDRLDEAEKVLREIIVLNPEYGPPWSMLSMVLVLKGDCEDKDEQVFRKALELEPDSGPLWSTFGIFIENQLGRYEEAKTAYRKAIEFGDADTWGFLIRLVHEKMGRKDEAFELLREYLAQRDVVKGLIDQTNDLLVKLVASGCGEEVVAILAESASKDVLEPLEVGLRMYLGEEVKAAAEVVEVGKDVVKRIEQQRDKEPQKGEKKKQKEKK